MAEETPESLVKGKKPRPASLLLRTGPVPESLASGSLHSPAAVMAASGPQKSGPKHDLVIGRPRAEARGRSITQITLPLEGLEAEAESLSTVPSPEPAAASKSLSGDLSGESLSKSGGGDSAGSKVTAPTSAGGGGDPSLKIGGERMPKLSTRGESLPVIGGERLPRGGRESPPKVAPAPAERGESPPKIGVREGSGVMRAEKKSQLTPRSNPGKELTLTARADGRTVSVFLSPFVKGTAIEQKLVSAYAVQPSPAPSLASPEMLARHQAPGKAVPEKKNSLISSLLKRPRASDNSTNPLPIPAPTASSGQQSWPSSSGASPADVDMLMKYAPEIQLSEMLFLENIPQQLFAMLPRLLLEPAEPAPPLASMFGPSRTVMEERYLHVAAAAAVSTYPLIDSASGSARQGDPICDKWCARLFRSRQVICLTDGCGWGERSARASELASKRFVDYVSDRIHKIRDPVHAGDLLIRAVGSAHSAIVEEDPTRQVWEVGTTTLFGAVILKLQHSQFCIVSVSIGDCRGFLFHADSQKVSIICKPPLQNNDRRDPGGALGPVNQDGLPDLRNLALSVKLCSANDMVLVMSDGVHDNLSPEYLMIDPTTLGLREPEWSANPPEKAERIINQYSKKVLRDLIAGGQQTPGHIVDRLIAFVIETTEAARSLLESSTRSPQTQLPGKMDHTTCLCLKISNLAELGPTRKSSTGHRPPILSPPGLPLPPLPSRTASQDLSTLSDVVRTSVFQSVKSLIEQSSNVPLSVSVGSTVDSVVILCRSVKGSLQVYPAGLSLSIKVIPAPHAPDLIPSSVSWTAGVDEFSLPIERTILLPAPIDISTQEIRIDPSGCVCITYAKAAIIESPPIEVP